MRGLAMLLALATGCMFASSAQAQSWQYTEEVLPDEGDPFTANLRTARAGAQTENGSIWVACAEQGLTVVGVFDGAGSLPAAEIGTVRWRIDQGIPTGFEPDFANGEFYVVRPPESVELAKLLVDAEHFISSNGAGEIRAFENLADGHEVVRVLRFCGH